MAAFFFDKLKLRKQFRHKNSCKKSNRKEKQKNYAQRPLTKIEFKTCLSSKIYNLLKN